jgi:hypothetical protein
MGLRMAVQQQQGRAAAALQGAQLAGGPVHIARGKSFEHPSALVAGRLEAARLSGTDSVEDVPSIQAIIRQSIISSKA